MNSQLIPNAKRREFFPSPFSPTPRSSRQTLALKGRLTQSISNAVGYSATIHKQIPCHGGSPAESRHFDLRKKRQKPEIADVPKGPHPRNHDEAVQPVASTQSLNHRKHIQCRFMTTSSQPSKSTQSTQVTHFHITALQPAMERRVHGFRKCSKKSHMCIFCRHFRYWRTGPDVPTNSRQTRKALAVQGSWKTLLATLDFSTVRSYLLRS